MLGGLFSSCQKSYESVPLGQQVTLDLAFDPLDSLGKQAMSYLLTTYQQALYSGHNRIGGNYLDAASDDAISSASGIPSVQALATGAYSAAQTNADDMWSRNYTAIRNATVFVVYINRVPMLEKLPNGYPARSAYRSEARWLRAWLYWQLVKRYGGVPLLGDAIRQITDDVRELHLHLSGLQPSAHGGLNSALRLRVPYPFAEEIGIATEVLGRRERDRVDPVLDRHMAGGRKRGDPMGERLDEIAERVGGQRSVDPAVPFSQFRVVVLRAQHDLERSGAAHEAREVLGSAPAGEQTERRLELTEDR